MASDLCGPPSLGPASLGGPPYGPPSLGPEMWWPDTPLSWQRAFNATSFLRHIRKLGQSLESEEASGRRVMSRSHQGLPTSQPPEW